MKRYRERLNPPPVWWVLAALLALSAGVAVGFYLGLPLGLGVGVAAMAVGAAVLISASTEIVVEDRWFRVGRARIEFDYVGGCRALDAEQTSRRSGPEADARAYLVQRPYVATAVEVAVDDAADPAPYWLVSSRRPAALVAAIEERTAAVRA
jgi:hypothetical protein